MKKSKSDRILSYLLLCRVIRSVFDRVSDSNVLPLGPPRKKE